MQTKELYSMLRQVHAEEVASASLLRLTAYESAPSRLVSRLASSPLSRDYHLGSLDEHAFADVVELHGLTFRGLRSIYRLEAIARDTALARLGASEVDFRPLS